MKKSRLFPRKYTLYVFHDNWASPKNINVSSSEARYILGFWKWLVGCVKAMLNLPTGTKCAEGRGILFFETSN